MADLKGSDFIKPDFLKEQIKEVEKFKKALIDTANIGKKAAKGVVKELQNVTGAQKEGQKVIEKSEKQTEQLVKAQEKYELSLKETNQELVRLKAAQRQQNQVNKLTEKLNRSAEGSYDALSAKYSLNKIKLNQMSKAQREATKGGQKLEKQTKQIFTQMNNLQKATGKATLQVGQYSRANAFAITSLRNLAGALGFTGLVFALVSAFKNAINTVKDFDAEMVNLAAILGEDRADLGDLEKEIRRVAKTSINTANDVAKLTTSLVTLGKTKEEILNLLEPVNSLSIALKAPADQAGELLVKTLNAFGESSDSATRFANIIAKVRTSTALDFEQIKIALGFLAPTARAAGISFEKTSAILGVLVDNGIKAQRAGRLMSSSFLKLADSGLTLEDALSIINQAQLETDDNLELLSVASGLFGKESAALGLILADNTKKVEDYTESFKNVEGSLDQLTRDQLKSMTNQVKLLDSAWTEFLLNIDNGEGIFAGIARAVIKSTISLIEFGTAISNALKKDDPFGEGEERAVELSKAIGFVLPKAVQDYSNQLEKAKKVVEEFREANVSTGKVAVRNAGEWRDLRDEVLKLEGVMSVLNDEMLKAEKIKLEEQLKKDALAAEELAKKEARLLALQRKRREEAEKNRKISEKLREERKKEAAEFVKFSSILQKQNDRRNKQSLQAGKELIDQTHALRLSEIDLINATEEEKTFLRLDAEKKRLQAIIRLNEVFDGELSALQIQQMKNVIQSIDNEISAAKDSGDFENLFDVFGIRLGETEEMQQRILGFVDVIKSSIMSIANTRVQAANAAVQASQTEIQAAQTAFDEQNRLRERGLANDVSGAKSRLNAAKRTNAIALKEQEKAKRNQERLQTAEQISSIITASANIFKGWSSIPFVGPVLGAAAVAAMIGSFIASKVSAKRATKLGKGDAFDVGGGTHASGNDTFIGTHGGVDHFAERGEVQGIVSSKSVRKYGSGKVKEVINSLNKGVFEKKYGNVFTSAAQMPEYVMGRAGADNEDMKSFMRSENDRANKDLAKTVKRMPQTKFSLDDKGYRRAIREGQTTRIDSELENEW